MSGQKFLEAINFTRDKLTQYEQERQVRVESLARMNMDPLEDHITNVRKNMQDMAAQSFQQRGSAFFPLTEAETAILEEQMTRHVSDGKLRRLSRELQIARRLPILFANGETDTDVVKPWLFRRHMIGVFEELIRYTIKFDRLDPDSALCLAPWRAGLAGSIAAHSRGFKWFAHLGSSRNEETLKANERYHFRWPVGEWSGSKVIITDPMLAGGETAIDAINAAIACGVREENIWFMAAVCAPEGIDKVLHRFPYVKIMAASIQKGLNENGYIKCARLGDAGDMFFKDWSHEQMHDCLVKTGIITEAELQTIISRK